MAFGVVSTVLEWVGANPGQAGLGITLVGSALYWRKGKAVAGLFGSVVGKAVFAAAVVGLLLLLGYASVDVAALLDGVGAAWRTGVEVVREVVG